MNFPNAHVRVMTICVTLIHLLGALALAGPDPLDGAAWRAPYTGDQARGEQVIAFWPFDPADPSADASGSGHVLSLRGEESGWVTGERFGGALEVRSGEGDSRQGASAESHPALSPEGAFTVEMWIRPSAELVERRHAFLLDKKSFHYRSDHARANQDYLLMLDGPVDAWTRRLRVILGFGSDSEIFISNEITFEQDRWYHVAFSYDAAGTVIFHLDGQQVGKQQVEGRGPVAPGRHPLIIGDRVGSTHHRFTGRIAQVRLTRGVIPFVSGELGIHPTPTRRVFQRLEAAPVLQAEVSNGTGRALAQATLLVQVVDTELPATSLTLGALPPGERRRIELPLPSHLQQGDYSLLLQPEEAGQSIGSPQTLSFQIANRYLPGQMPFVMWGNGPIEPIHAMGFTHQFSTLVWIEPIWSARAAVAPLRPDRFAEQLRRLDDMLAAGQQGLAFMNSFDQLNRLARNHPEAEDQAVNYRAMDEEGNLYDHAQTLDPNFPRLREYARHMTEAVAREFGPHPALKGALIHSENRDHTRISWHEMNRTAYREATGHDFPAGLQGPRGTHHRTLADFPTDRVVEDDHPVLQFYRWFWKEGDGWNRLQTEGARGFHTTNRADQWSFYDPAVRVPSLYGSGGEVDVISHWTYTYPDPLKVALATDELFAMARGRPGQQVMTMTQAFMKRWEAAPAPKEGKDNAPQVAWEKEHPEARYFTTSPDILRQSIWLMLSRPVQGVMIHGLGSILPPNTPGLRKGGYIHTHPDAQQVITEAAHSVVHPLGATLLQVPDRPTDIAFLESFTSQMFARRGGYGWAADWSADAYMALNWAHLQPEVIYEETLLQEGLDRYRVLVLADCDVLPRSVVQAIGAWQDRGGILIADERLPHALQPDILMPVYQRTRQADLDKAALQQLAANLRAELDDHYTRHLDASHPDVLVRARQWGEADYLFAINDHRTFGDYVGHHGLVMEKGLPGSATLQLHRTGGVLYDVLASQQVVTTRSGDSLSWPVALAPGDGKLFLRVPRPITHLALRAPTQARPGQTVVLQVELTDDAGQAVPAVLPIEVHIRDAAGEMAEFSGHYGAANGQFELPLDLPSNATAGDWRIAVRDLASGLEAQHTMTLAR